MSENTVLKLLSARTRSAEETLNGFHEDGEAQCEQEDTIHQSRQNLSTMPSVRILRVRFRGFPFVLICELLEELSVRRPGEKR